jgi:glutamate/tyrosine decarboxylase-like PLP-dependent enzyme
MTKDAGPGRSAALEMSPEEFREAGNRLVEKIAGFLSTLPERPVSPNESPKAVRRLIGGPLPAKGEPAARLLDEAAELLFSHSLFNGHPRFWAYITSSAAPIGALGDLLAGAVNPNIGGWDLAPIATEIELETVRWIAELIGYPTTCGGILVSGGNMANFVAFLAARRARAGWDVRKEGLGSHRMTLYASVETHTWVQKAADLFGLGTDAIRWIGVDAELRMDVAALEAAIRKDRADGAQPFLLVGTAGSVSTGAIDPLPELARVAKEHGLWFHVDGAYGGFAAALPDAPADLKALSLADSIAIDPHKWLYAPLEAGCTLVRDPEALTDAFSYSPSYYRYSANQEEEPVNFHERGPQNSRGFRALKVWLGLKQAGRDGYVTMIGDDIRLAHELFARAGEEEELETSTCSLSIATFRYVPADLRGDASAEKYLNDLNAELMKRIRASGAAWVSNALVDGKFLLRACVVNFRTTSADVASLPPLTVSLGREVDAEMRATLRAVGR